MPDWSRDNVAWRQGQFLSGTDAATLGLIPPEKIEAVLVVIVSHDCDIANDIGVEPDVEIILGQVVAESNPNFKFRKNPRCLEFKLESEQFLQLDIRTVVKRPKEALFELQPAGQLPKSDLQIFQDWLAARYSRPAFPDDFDTLIKSERIAEKLSQWGKTFGAVTTALLFSLEQIDGFYKLAIVVLYKGDDLIEAKKTAKAYSEKIEDIFEKKFYNEEQDNWTAIKLVFCDVVSEHEMTMARAREFQRWDLDSVSYAADPQQPLPHQ